MWPDVSLRVMPEVGAILTLFHGKRMCSFSTRSQPQNPAAQLLLLLLHPANLCSSLLSRRYFLLPPAELQSSPLIHCYLPPSLSDLCSAAASCRLPQPAVNLQSPPLGHRYMPPPPANFLSLPLTFKVRHSVTATCHQLLPPPSA